MSYLLFKWELGECLPVQQVRQTTSLKVYETLLSFFYICGLVLFLAICVTTQYFEGLVTANNIDGRFCHPS